MSSLIRLDSHTIWKLKDRASLLDVSLVMSHLPLYFPQFFPFKSKNLCYFLLRAKYKRERWSGSTWNPFSRCTWSDSGVSTPGGCVFHLEIMGRNRGRKNTAANINGVNSFTWFKKKINYKGSCGSARSVRFSGRLASSLNVRTSRKFLLGSQRLGVLIW